MAVPGWNALIYQSKLTFILEARQTLRGRAAEARWTPTDRIKILLTRRQPASWQTCTHSKPGCALFSWRIRVWSGSPRGIAWWHHTLWGGTGRHARCRTLPAAAGAEHAVDGDAGRAEDQGGAGRGVGGARGECALAVPGVCDGVGAV